MANMVIRVFFAMLMGAQTVTAQDPIGTLKTRVASRISEVQGATVGEGRVTNLYFVIASLKIDVSSRTLVRTK